MVKNDKAEDNNSKKTTEEEFWDATKAVKKLIDDYTKSIEF